MSSLLLDTQTWSLCVDADRNLAVCSPPYSLAQDAACHARLFRGELRYDATQGVDYWGLILGRWPPIALVKAKIAFAAMQATGVGDARVAITSWKDRRLAGFILVAPEAAGPAAPAQAAPFAVSPAVAAY